MSKKESDLSNAIPKLTISAIIQTNTHRIQGNIHVMEWQRVSDALNATEGLFLAVTDAVGFNFDGDDVKRCPFLTVNKEHVVWVTPIEDPRKPGM